MESFDPKAVANFFLEARSIRGCYAHSKSSIFFTRLVIGISQTIVD